ncbi:interferon alpha-inducible protein 27-like protein 2A [Oryzias melastigma]|uniref:interferon alpha-inducible protein 27-like protein 2A n=1 Tax=Oryzias melastigma TaxID=30732 RepID=UPI00168CD99C|nr:interferon alpha-inducible protein 27-like protein 2A [Oryzias melastigma]
MEELCKAVLIGGGGVAAVVLTPAVIAALGFSATGIVAGSIAAKLMALLSGGWPGLIALLQSFGAVGFSWSGFTLTFATGGALGNMISGICNQTRAP